VIDRDTGQPVSASPPRQSDDTLYDAFRSAASCDHLYSTRSAQDRDGGPIPSSGSITGGALIISISGNNAAQADPAQPRSPRWATSVAPLAINHQGLFPSVTPQLQFSLPNVALGDAVTAVNNPEDPDRHARYYSELDFQGTAPGVSSPRWPPQPVLIVAPPWWRSISCSAVLYESVVHPITILSTPSFGRPSAAPGSSHAGWGAARCHGPGRHHSLDRHRQEECHHDDRFSPLHGGARWDVAEASHYPGLHPCGSGPITMTTLCALFGRSTSGTRHGCRIGIAASARHRDRRRSLRLAIVDAVHNAGSLSLHGNGSPASWLRSGPKGVQDERLRFNHLPSE